MNVSIIFVEMLLRFIEDSPDFLSHAEAQRTQSMKYDFSSLSANPASLRDNIILHSINDNNYRTQPNFISDELDGSNRNDTDTDTDTDSDPDSDWKNMNRQRRPANVFLAFGERDRTSSTS